MISNKKILVFGEVLFDYFGDQEIVLGGAPFNVAWHLQGFGLNPLFVSRVGDDKRGQIVRQRMQDCGMTLAGLQTDKIYPTGLVTVDIADNEPKFKILAGQAYDQIKISGKESILSDFPYEIVYHGTLALRNETSYFSLKRITGKKDCRIFLDVNLRDPLVAVCQIN
jgi:fructokinase